MAGSRNCRGPVWSLQVTLCGKQTQKQCSDTSSPSSVAFCFCLNAAGIHCVMNPVVWETHAGASGGSMLWGLHGRCRGGGHVRGARGSRPPALSTLRTLWPCWLRRGLSLRRGSHAAWICWPPNAQPELGCAQGQQAEVLTRARASEAGGDGGQTGACSQARSPCRPGEGSDGQRSGDLPMFPGPKHGHIS